MKNYAALLLTVCATLSVAACGKRGDKPVINSTDNTGIMSSILQLPVPDQSYSSTSSSFAVTAQANERNLVSAVNALALPLKESNSKFAQVVSEGTRTNSGLTITHSTINAQLVGVKDDKNGIINWTYTKSGATYFSGQTNLAGTVGELLFPISAISARPVTVSWESSSKVSVRADAANFLEFSLNRTSSTVDFAGLINGTVALKGKWTSSGGSYTEGANAPARCWNARLENADCL